MVEKYGTKLSHQKKKEKKILEKILLFFFRPNRCRFELELGENQEK